MGWWLTKTHESLDGLGDGMILLQEAQASTSAMMGKRMDGLETSIQRLVAGLDGVRAAHPELDGTILAYEAPTRPRRSDCSIGNISCRNSFECRP